MKFRKDFYPEDIAEVICKNKEVKPEEVMPALEWLMCAAGNPYESDSFEALWEVLQESCEPWRNNFEN